MRRLLSFSVVSSILWCLVVAASPAIEPGQKPSVLSQEQVAKLDFLIGEWKGKGGSCRPDGTCGNEITQSTTVKREKDGSTLSINDKKKYPDLRIAPGNPFPGMILNYPMAMSGAVSVYYDEGTTQYYWRWETPEGRKKPFPATLVAPKTFQIKLEFPGVLSRVTIEVTDVGEWREKQESWRSDKNAWVKTQETVLKKVK